MSSDGMEMTVQMKPRGKDENVEASMIELKSEVEDLRQLVHTLLTIIMEEADGIQSGAAPTIPNQPKRRFSM